MSSDNVLDQVKKLREITGVGFSDCKKAIDENLINKNNLVELGLVIDSKISYRKSENDITVADLTGVAVQDIMITNAVYNKLKN